MANNQAVRKVLEGRGIKIPGDSHFVAAAHDTTRNDVTIVDLEDVPATHRKDLLRLLDDLEEAGAKVEMRFTFIEIYNENVRDLLS